MGSLQTLIENLELDSSLRQTDRLRERIDALDLLEVHLLSRHVPADSAAAERNAELDRRAEAVRARLETDNAGLYASLRGDIRRGLGADRLLALLPRPRDDGTIECARGESYDYLDELVSGILELTPPEAADTNLTSEMVRYQPTPARHIFDLIARTRLGEDDVLIDLGSGLGHVPLLAAICTGARTVGIELEPAYVECARRCAEALNLERATFIRQDARSADFSTGTVFYLYTPFTGSILRAVLDSLRRQAEIREIRVCAYGPCVPTVAEEKWLVADGPVESGRVSAFRATGLSMR